MGFLTLPIMLAGLVALPVLAGVYLFQMRYRRRVVSSHVIWQQLTAVQAGGQRVQQFQPPWLLLLLELLILGSLVVAAAGPRATAATVRVPVAVVLNDAFAMAAGREESVRERAVEALEERLEPGRHRVRLVAAGVEPRLVGQVIESHAGLRRALEDWQPRGPRGDMDAAIARASEMVGESGRVMVLSDRGPGERELAEQGRILWWAGGEAEANVAIVNAWRGEAAEAAAGQVVGVEVANFSEERREVVVRFEQEGRTAERISAALQAGQTRQVRTTVTAEHPVRVTVEGEDALAADDTAVLLDGTRPAVRVAIALDDETTAERVGEAVRRAMEATGRVRFTAAAEAELVVTDSPEVRATPERHVLRLVRGEGETGVLSGPFAMDTTHPVTEGLTLSGVQWAVGRGDEQAADEDAPAEGATGEVADGAEVMGGTGVVVAGNETLISVAEHASGGRTVWLQWRAEGSNLAESPDWVILLDNLLRWRQAARPGAAQANLAVGQLAHVRLPRGVDEIELRSPGGERRTVRGPGGAVTLALEEVGVWEFEADHDERPVSGTVAVNAISRAASDLREAESGQWGGWEDVQTLGRSYREVAWVIVLLATGLLLCHAWVLRRTGGGA